MFWDFILFFYFNKKKEFLIVIVNYYITIINFFKNDRFIDIFNVYIIIIKNKLYKNSKNLNFFLVVFKVQPFFYLQLYFIFKNLLLKFNYFYI